MQRQLMETVLSIWGEGSTVTTSVKGEIDSQYTLHNDVTASDMAVNIIDNTKDITTKGGTTIFSNCSDCLNPETLSKNLVREVYSISLPKVLNTAFQNSAGFLEDVYLKGISSCLIFKYKYSNKKINL